MSVVDAFFAGLLVLLIVIAVLCGILFIAALLDRPFLLGAVMVAAVAYFVGWVLFV